MNSYTQYIYDEVHGQGERERKRETVRTTPYVTCPTIRNNNNSNNRKKEKRIKILMHSCRGPKAECRDWFCRSREGHESIRKYRYKQSVELPRRMLCTNTYANDRTGIHSIEPRLFKILTINAFAGTRDRGPPTSTRALVKVHLSMTSLHARRRVGFSCASVTLSPSAAARADHRYGKKEKTRWTTAVGRSTTTRLARLRHVRWRITDRSATSVVMIAGRRRSLVVSRPHTPDTTDPLACTARFTWIPQTMSASPLAVIMALLMLMLPLRIASHAQQRPAVVKRPPGPDIPWGRPGGYRCRRVLSDTGPYVGREKKGTAGVYCSNAHH